MRENREQGLIRGDYSISLIQRIMMKERRPLIQSIDIIFLEGVHFHHITEYYLALVENINLIYFLNTDWVYKAEEPSQANSNMAIYKVETKGRGIFIKESRNEKHCQALYWLQGYNKERGQERQDCHLRITVKSELQIVKEQMNRSIIRVTIDRYITTDEVCLSDLIKMGNRRYLFKPNYCTYRRYNEITYPFARIIKEKTYGKKELILVLNQTNLRELPFFVGAISQMSKNHRITKIIGHPSSLFLAFMIDREGNVNEKMRETLLKYKSFSKPQSKPIQNVTRTQILKSIMFKFLAEQSILNESLTEFLVDNIVNDQFIADFTVIIRLYYRIFLKEDIAKEEIEAAIEQYFYYDEQNIQKYAFNFTTLLTLFEFRHNLEGNGLIYALLKQVEGNFGSLETITLQDLYNYNSMEFTFIGLDLHDKIVRFFNHKTTPKLPIIAIFSLLQFLPTPYKSFIWRQEWGRYHIQYETTMKEININMHEIVDSRFLLECPMDLIGDRKLRNCFMSEESEGTVIHALCSARRKVDDLPQIEELKTLLKAMKSNAIDSLPKFRLIWKILTTKSKIDLDLNNLDTFRQIPLLGRAIQLDETYKCYLQNINKEVNNDRILKSTALFLYSGKHPLGKMCKNLQKLYSLFDQYIKNETYSERKQSQLAEDIEKLQKQAKRTAMKSYQECLHVISKVKEIIKCYHLQSRYKYKMQIEAIIDKINFFPQFMDFELIDQAIKQLVNLLKMARLKAKKETYDFDPQSSGYLRDTFLTINQAQKVSQGILGLLQQLKMEINLFKGQAPSLQAQIAVVKYERIMHRFCLRWVNLVEKGSKGKRIKELYSEVFKITPHIYLAEQRARQQFMAKQALKNMLYKVKERQKIHLIFNGQSLTLIDLAERLIYMKDCLISRITSTNYHSIAAFLYCLKLDDDTFLQQLVGLENLVTVNITNANDDSLNLVELLLHRQEGQGEQEQSHELYLRIARKYQAAFKLMIQLQSDYHIKIHKLYLLIDEYDKEQQSLPIDAKEKEIVNFLQTLLQNQKEHSKKVDLVEQNKEMINEKLKLNKIGIKFMIRFMYRSVQRQHNWFNIHTQNYKVFTVYQRYLKDLFIKYNLAHDITLQEFNSINPANIKLSFLLVNYNKNRFQLFEQGNGSMKLIDLLLAAVCMPVDSAPKIIDIQQRDNKERIGHILTQSTHKFTTHSKEEQYWSCLGINSAPFNIVQKTTDKDTILLGFQFFPRTYETSIQRQRQNRQSLRSNDDKSNLRTIDLLSMWWTKSKKLTPQMKSIIFGSIFQSPFLKFYSLIQNSSYEDLITVRQQRNVVNLDQEWHDLIVKGSTVGQYFSKKKIIIFKLMRKESVIEMEVIDIIDKVEVKMQESQSFLCEGQTYLLKQGKNKLILYNFTQKYLEKYQLCFQIPQQGSEHYYKIDIINQQVSISSYPLGNLLKCECKLHLYDLKSNNDPKKPQLDSQVSTCSTGNDAKKLKRGNLNLYLLTHQSRNDEYNEFKCKIIEEVRQSIILAPVPTVNPNPFCCCFRKVVEQQ